MSRRAIAFLGMPLIARMLALPEGLRPVACRDDFMRDGVAVLVEGDALDDQPDCAELPRLPMEMLDRSELAMTATATGFCSDNGRNVTVDCPLCHWSREWDSDQPAPSLLQLADAVQQHLNDEHGMEAGV